MDTETKTQVIQDASVESILAEKCLDESLTAPGSICSYEKLRLALGQDPRRAVYGYIATARRRFERKHDCVLEAIPNEGIKWLTPEEVVRVRWDRDIGHIRRSSKATLRRQKTTLDEKAEKALSPEGLKRRNQNLAFAGVLTLMSKPKTERKIAEAADQSNRILPAVEALKHFGKE